MLGQRHRRWPTIESTLGSVIMLSTARCDGYHDNQASGYHAYGTSTGPPSVVLLRTNVQGQGHWPVWTANNGTIEYCGVGVALFISRYLWIIFEQCCFVRCDSGTGTIPLNHAIESQYCWDIEKSLYIINLSLFAFHTSREHFAWEFSAVIFSFERFKLNFKWFANPSKTFIANSWADVRRFSLCDNDVAWKPWTSPILCPDHMNGSEPR